MLILFNCLCTLLYWFIAGWTFFFVVVVHIPLLLLYPVVWIIRKCKAIQMMKTIDDVITERVLNKLYLTVDIFNCGD